MNELKPPTRVHYDADFYAWSNDQARRLRLAKPEGLDWENVAEEIESLGKSDRRAIASNLNVILKHLIKWQYQPEKRKAGWRASIREHRERIERIVADSPSLRAFLTDALGDEYRRARAAAVEQTGLSERAIPKTSPFTIEQVLDPDFMP